jgi:hypothetical protein
MLTLTPDNKETTGQHRPTREDEGSWAYSLQLLDKTIQGVTKVSPASLVWRTGSLSEGAYVSDAEGTSGVITRIKHHVAFITTTATSTVTSSSEQYPISAIEGLEDALAKKADLDEGKVKTEQIPIDWISDQISSPNQPLAQNIVAAENISAYHFVAVDENNQLINAGSQHPRPIGMIKTAVLIGETAAVYTTGVFTSSGWDFELNKPLLLGNFGEPTQTDVQSVIVYVGTVIDPHTFVMRISEPYFNL